MFLTHESDRVHIPQGLLQTGESGWTMMRLAIEAPWFVVELQPNTDGVEGYRGTVFVTRLSTLEELMKACRIWVVSLQVVTPGYVNGTGTWSIDTVEQIWQRQGHAIYLLTNGDPLGWPSKPSDIPWREEGQLVLDMRPK